MHCINGDHDISDIDLFLQRTRDAGIDHMSDPEQIAQDLHAQSRADLADPAADYYCFCPADPAFIKMHSGLLRLFRAVHAPDKTCHFNFHCSDNSDLHPFSSLSAALRGHI